MKKILISLLVWFVWFVWFWYSVNVWLSSQQWVWNNWRFDFYPWMCFRSNQNWSCELSMHFYNSDTNSEVYTQSSSYNWFFCPDFTWRVYNYFWWNCTYEYFNTKTYCPVCDECTVDTWSILSGSCDINYCVENWLCPTSSWSRSELVINNIVHEWRPLINLNIPDYITWDYTVDENQYDVYVWSWYDQDYIDSILAINSYRPDSQDFTQIFVSWLTLIFPYIFVALLIVFIWKLLKRIFK